MVFAKLAAKGAKAALKYGASKLLGKKGGAKGAKRRSAGINSLAKRLIKAKIQAKITKARLSAYKGF